MARALWAVILGALARAYFSSGTGLIWHVLMHHLSSLRMAPTLSSGTLESADLMARTCGSTELSLGVYGRVFVRLRPPAFFACVRLGPFRLAVARPVVDHAGLVEQLARPLRAAK